MGVWQQAPLAHREHCGCGRDMRGSAMMHGVVSKWQTHAASASCELHSARGSMTLDGFVWARVPSSMPAETAL